MAAGHIVVLFLDCHRMARLANRSGIDLMYWQIDIVLTDFHVIGRLAMDWYYISELLVDVNGLAWNWQIGMGDRHGTGQGSAFDLAPINPLKGAVVIL